MTWTTRYSSLSDDEFISVAESKNNGASPIISELIGRLEKTKTEENTSLSNAQQTIENLLKVSTLNDESKEQIRSAMENNQIGSIDWKEVLKDGRVRECPHCEASLTSD